MNDLISIIIPIYNAEKYIDKCIKSVINQTYRNLEIILIDDGSTDLSGDIIDKYQKKDKRIIVKHIKNSGVSVARNIGLSMATGHYIGFVDSDDYIEAIMIESLYNSILKYNSDIAVCNMFFEDVNSVELKSFHYDISILNKNDYIEKLFYAESIHGYCWNKLYSSRIIGDKKVRFDKKASVLEDDLFNVEIVCKNKSLTVSYVDNKLYHYVIHDGSTSISTYNVRKLSYFYARNLEINMLGQADINVNYLKVDYCAAFIRAKILMKKNDIAKNCDYYEFERCFKKYRKEITFCDLNKKLKLKYLIVKFFPFIYRVKIYIETR